MDVEYHRAADPRVVHRRGRLGLRRFAALLQERFGEHFRGGRRKARSSFAHQLVERLGISYKRASQLVRSLERGGYLRPERRGVRIARAPTRS